MAKKDHQLSEDPPMESLSDEETFVAPSEEEDEPNNHVQIPSGEAEFDTEPAADSSSLKKKNKKMKKKMKKKSVREETTTPVNVKRSKQEDVEETMTEITKKAYFERVWSEEDDIAILNGILNFASERGKSYKEDLNAFYEYVKERITWEGKNLVQFINKINTLKKKYKDKRKKGVAPSFAKPHDQACFELSDLIWASEFEFKKNKMKIKLESSETEGEMVSDCFTMDSFLVESIARLGIDEECVMQKWSLVPEETKKKIQSKWQMLQDNAMDAVVQKADFVKEVASLLAKGSING